MGLLGPINAEHGLGRWHYALCIVAMIVLGFAVAHEQGSSIAGWVFFTAFVCFPTAMRSENLGYSARGFLALFIPGLNVVFVLACLAFPEEFATRRKLDRASIGTMLVIAIVALFWGSLWYREWRASQPFLQYSDEQIGAPKLAYCSAFQPLYFGKHSWLFNLEPIGPPTR